MRSFDVPDPPPLAAQRGETYPRLIDLIRRLLAPDGCPWDRSQSIASLRSYLMEEAAEVADAIDGGDREQLKDELGDLLMQIAFISELGAGEGAFSHDDVIRAIIEKLVRRHPHIFGDSVISDVEAERGNWHRIKAAERGASSRRLLDRVPRSLPTLMRAQQLGDEAARVGFDWSDLDSCAAKVGEEMDELREAIDQGGPEHIEEELGDVLFSLVNLARHVNIDADAALRRTLEKFCRRFELVERRVEETRGGWTDQPVDIAILDHYWNEAKDRVG